MVNMSVHTPEPTVTRPGRGGPRGGRPSLLDVAAEVLVADPAASLAQVAEAAGIGRTTLHKHYATRDDLLFAVAHRALDLWEQALAAVTPPAQTSQAPTSQAAADQALASLRALFAAMIPIGPQLAFLWRTPAFDHVPEIDDRWATVEALGLVVLKQAQHHGLLTTDVPDWWLSQTFYSITYVAAESVGNGKLAPLDAPDLAYRTFLRGLATPAAAAPAATSPAATSPAVTPQGSHSR
jgi:AcrR family transcriptional regulator